VRPGRQGADECQDQKHNEHNSEHFSLPRVFKLSKPVLFASLFVPRTDDGPSLSFGRFVYLVNSAHCGSAHSESKNGGKIVLACIAGPPAAIIAATFSVGFYGMKRTRLIFLGAALKITTSLFAQQSEWPPAQGHVTLQVWPGAARGATANPPAEANTTTAKDNLIAGKPLIRLGNVSVPTLTLYRAKGDGGSKPAVVVFPGGGYSILAIDLEGTEVCDWLNSAGVTCVLLKYRVPNTGPFPKSPAALQDAQRAIGLVREHASEWGIDPNRIGVLGFSAGGHLAAAISTHFDQRLYDPIDAADKLSCRPDFAVVVYPGYLALAEKNFAANADINPTANTPPTFIVQAEDDPVHVENALVYFQQLKDATVPAELHIYAQGGHGYGLRRTELPVTTWPASVEIWLRTIKVLPAH
jgi:acetyl esterase/lipase